MSSQPTSRFACGLICTGFVFGMSFSVRHSTKTIAAMKMTASTVARLRDEVLERVGDC